MKPTASPYVPFIGTLNARLTSVYQSDMTRYAPSEAIARKPMAEESCSFAPTATPLARRIWKIWKVKVRSYQSGLAITHTTSDSPRPTV
jgi:hypothetical protein